MSLSSLIVLWMHLLAAMALIGGVIVLRLIVRPVMAERSESRTQELMGRIGRRFRTLAWISVITLVLTGSFNLLSAEATERLETEWGVVLMIKLFVFAVMVGLLLVHDFILDPYRDLASGLSSASRPPSATAVGFLQNALVVTNLVILFLGSYLASL